MERPPKGISSGRRLPAADESFLPVSQQRLRALLLAGAATVIAAGEDDEQAPELLGRILALVVWFVRPTPKATLGRTKTCVHDHPSNTAGRLMDSNSSPRVDSPAWVMRHHDLGRTMVRLGSIHGADRDGTSGMLEVTSRSGQGGVPATDSSGTPSRPGARTRGHSDASGYVATAPPSAHQRRRGAKRAAGTPVASVSIR